MKIKVLGFAVLMIFAAVACNTRPPEPPIALGDPVPVPNTDFMIQPPAEYTVGNLSSALFIYKSRVRPEAQLPTFLIGGGRLEEGQSGEMWLEERLAVIGSGDVKPIVVNGISGFVIDDEVDDANEIVFPKLAILATETYSFSISVATDPGKVAAAVRMFDAMLESVTLVESKRETE